MITKYILPTFLLLLLSVFATAQEKKCGVENPEDFGLLMNDATALRVQAIKDNSVEWIANQQHRSTPRELITIPVVVHIVYYDDSENYTDLEVEAQIDGLTADFRKLNNIDNIPEVFRDLAVDTEIEFCLANIIDGVPTNGILRTKTPHQSIGTPYNGVNRICYTDEGGSDAINPEEYVNIWVGQMPSLIAGRATMPGQADTALEDGIFIDPDFFGFFCSSSNDFFLGRTLTHEMGHYLNLLHIWGDGGGSDDNCMIDDGISDTPMQEKSYSGRCPSHPQESCGGEDMFMNFMDYTDDRCLSMFTFGQKLMMRSVLDEDGPRGKLRTSQGCAGMTKSNITLTPDDITIFPNPASDCIHIDLDIDNDLPVRFQVINSLGQAVHSSNVFAKDLRTFNVSNLSNGVYFIFFENNKQIASKKLIVDK